MNKMPEIDIDSAIELYNSRFWEGLTDREIVEFQLFTPRLCMPFDVFHGAVEKVLDRPVFTHEFAYGGIVAEFLGDKQKPSFEDVLGLIPKDKLAIVVVALDDEGDEDEEF